MGVTGLWKLIEPCGMPVPIETLEGKILAVDISIWLHQVVKGFQDSNGSALAQAHLLGLFHRLCKLMFYRVKPVFVFDGCVPQLKRDTIARRQQQRSKLNNEANRIQNLLLEQLTKEQVVQRALGNAVNDLLPLKRITHKPSEKDNADDMFKLPELPTCSQNNSFQSSQDESVVETSFESSDEEENSARRYYNSNLQAIDVKGQDFCELPADMRYDILLDIKETRKQNSWGRLHELPAQRDEFSSFQMKRLLKRRAVQESLEAAEKEMGGRTLTYAELQTYFKEEGVLPTSAIEEASKQIACDENTRFLLVQDLKKQLKEKKSDTEDVELKEENKKDTPPINKEERSPNYEWDLNLAIALSLWEEENENRVDEVLQKTQVEETEDCVKLSDSVEAVTEAVKNIPYMVTETSKDCVSLSDSVEDVKNMEDVNKTNVDGLEVVIDLSKQVDDDLFADVFCELPKLQPVSMSLLSDSDSNGDLVEVRDEPEVMDSIQLAEGVAEHIKEGTLSCILNELKQKLAEINKLHSNPLDAEKINKQEINLALDGDVGYKKFEMIHMKTPPLTPMKTISKPTTPSSISDYYNTEYVIKRTPEKAEKVEAEDVAEIKSPFFRRKSSASPHTPKSSTSDIEMPSPCKAMQELFVEPKQFSTEEVLSEAATELKEQKSGEELRAMAGELAQERRELEIERNRQERMGMSISQRMNAECQELLRLFGVPYIVAPMEAEAQCAFLDAVKLTHGTITDDSDIWLFGGRTVYKNFFVQNKHVLQFSAEEIEAQFKCDRQTLVQLACLVGSDYTTGVHGIGAVTALEILSSFTRTEQKNADNIRQHITAVTDTLKRFRDWWQASKVSVGIPGSSARHTLLKKLRNIELNEGFPSMAVIEAYLLPKVDESRSTFSWGDPDVESLREFARKTFGWTTNKTDDILRPVLKRLAQKCTQTTIRNYFLTTNAISTRESKMSKRVKGAVQRLASGGEAAEEGVKETPVKKKKKRGKNNQVDAAQVEELQNKETHVIPQKQVIPQREKDLEKMRLNKQKAVELFKADAKKNKRKT